MLLTHKEVGGACTILRCTTCLIIYSNANCFVFACVLPTLPILGPPIYKNARGPKIGSVKSWLRLLAACSLLPCDLKAYNKHWHYMCLLVRKPRYSLHTLPCLTSSNRFDLNDYIRHGNPNVTSMRFQGQTATGQGHEISQ